MLFNINSQTWDSKLLQFFGIPQSMLPEIRSSAEHYGNMVRVHVEMNCRTIIGYVELVDFMTQFSLRSQLRCIRKSF